MKINRLFEIVYMLLSKENLTAKVLAEHFEVSTRTIYRDIETLCQSGIPIYMQQGKGGGIVLMEHFVLDKSVLSKEEREAFLGALEALKIAPQSEEALSRISSLLGERTKSWIKVDFSEWGGDCDEYFLQIKEAILKMQIIKISYYNGQGKESKRDIAPLQLCFKHRNWYLKAYCYTKKALRLFKLGRIQQLEMTSNYFEQDMESYLEQETNEQQFEIGINPTELLIGAQLGYRVYEEFRQAQIQKQENGSFKVTVYYPEDEWFYGYLLSFGAALEVLAPKHIQRELKRRIEKMLACYEKYDI